MSAVTTTRSLEEAAREAPSSVVQASTRALRAADSPARGAFLARVLNAVARLAREMDDASLGDAAGARSDYEVLLRALEEPAALAALRQDDPLAQARLRGLQSKLRLLETEGGVISAVEVASLLGITRQAVDKRRRAGRLIGLTLGRRGYAYPAWQFTERGTLPGLERVLEALRGHDPWMQAAFMVNPNTRLDGETPLSALRRGQTDAVIRAAAAYGEQGAGEVSPAASVISTVTAGCSGP